MTHDNGGTATALGELLERIENDPVCRLARQAAREASAGDSAHDSAHDEGHLLRVALWTLKLGGSDIDPREGILAALLHDLVNPPKTSPLRSKASELSAARSRELLAEQVAEPGLTRICDAIRDHSFSRGATPSEALGQALQDADRLETLGALGLLRVAATGARMSAAFYEPLDPFAENRELDDLRYTLDHFYTKLLRLPETLLTEAGRNEARSRARFLEAFLSQLGEEIGTAPPSSGSIAVLDQR